MMDQRDLFTNQLKSQTAGLHEKLDHAPLLSKVMDPSLTTDEYTRLLAKMCECFTLVENSILNAGGPKIFADYFYESRLPDLKKDLEKLGSAPMDFSAKASATEATSVATAVGMIYVLHGSSLGGQFISKKLAGLVPEGTLNFYGRSPEFIPAWAQFKEKLNNGQNSLSLAQAVAGATRAFETFYQVFIKA